MGVGIFSDFVFFLKVSSLPFKEKSKLKTSIISNGGAISFVLNGKVTHAVVTNTATLNSTQQRRIEKHCISVVSPDLIRTLLQGTPLTEAERQIHHKQSDVILDKAKDDKKSRFLSKLSDDNKKNLHKRNMEDDEEFEDDENGTTLPGDTEVAKYSFFEKDEEVAFVELLCSNESGSFPFKICTTRGQPETEQKEITFHLVDTAENACEKYELRMNDLKNKGFVQVQKVPPQAESFASQALQKVLIGEALSATELPPEVASFVDSIWVEALGHLGSILSCSVENISLNDVSKAEGILHQVRNALTKGDRPEDIHQMMLEFYRCIPHKEKMLRNIDKKFLTIKQDLCQLIRDMVNVCETSLPGGTVSTSGKYQALRCRVELVDPNTEEFRRVKQDVLDNNHSSDTFKILRVFRIGRLSEAIHFKSDLGNVKSLLHASSPCNFVGILSRGLMLPKIIVEEFGLGRTDIGNLGSGIYFSDSISTSVKYAECSTLNGARHMVLSDVALGKIKPYYKRDHTITEPPNGFDSVHGVRSEASVKSEFVDDEFVVYNVNQVKMRYAVQFCNSNDDLNSVKEFRFAQPEQVQEDNGRMSETLEDVSLDDLPEAEIMKGGLQSIGGEQIPLESIHVKARLMDLAAQVVIFQTYKNESSLPIEAKYVFPLDSTAAVCGFEAFINGKHIIGEVKEKQQAHREYRTAISEGHGAYLMDQDAPDVFTVSVGNLPPKSTVVIKISYVTELKCRYSITFSIPGTVASWQQDKALKENTQDVVTKVGIESGMAPEGSFCLDMSIEMPRKIENIFCSTHKIKIKKTDCKAVVQTLKASSLNDEGFSLDIYLEESYVPRMWVEKHPDEDSEACMLIFQPQFENTNEYVTITICLDCSNSMESCFRSAKLVALLALSSLYYNPINIILFGSTYKEFFFYPKRQSQDTSEMEKFIKRAKPNMGSTEFWKPLQSLCLLRPSKGHQKVILISDGHLQNENLVFQTLKKNKEHINFFTCGVGATANKHTLQLLAQCGAGAFEFFADKSKSSWKNQMEKQESRLRSPACTAVSIKWRQFGRNPPKPLQAPAHIHALFDNDNLFVYGFVPHCTQATLKALIDNKELENMVSTTALQRTTGTILHKLTARALIKDYEDGILHETEHENEMKKQEMKSFIIALSVQHSIVTQFTSFVAVEKRSAEEDLNIEPNVLEIISAEDVDILPYMDWTTDDSQRADTAGDKEDGSSSSEHYEKPEEMLYGLDLFQDAMEESEELYDELEVRSSAYEEVLEDSKLNVPPGRLPIRRKKKTGAVSYQSEPDEEPECIYDIPKGHAEAPEGFGSPGLFGQAADIPLPLHQLFQTHSAFASPAALSSPAFAPQAFGSAALSSPAFAPQAFGSAALSSPAFAPTALSSPAFGSAALSSPAFAPTPFGSAALSSPAFGVASAAFGSAALSSPAFAPPAFGSAALSSPAFGVASAAFGSAADINLPSHQFSQTRSASFASPVFGYAAQSVLLSSALGSSDSPAAGSAAPQVLAAKSIALDLSRAEVAAPVAFGSSSRFHEKQCRDANFIASPPCQVQAEIVPPPPPPCTLVSPAAPFSYQETSGRGFSARKALDSFEPAAYSVSDSSALDLTRAAGEAPNAFGRSALFGSKPSCDSYFSTGSIPSPLSLLQADTAPPPPPPRAPFSFTPQRSSIVMQKMLTKEQLQRPSMEMEKQKAKRYVAPSWSSLSSLQSQEGFWRLTPELGNLLNVNVGYLSEVFLIKKGIASLGSRGIEEIHKLMATLLVLQTIRRYNLLNDITFKSLMKLEQSFQTSLSYPSIKAAIEWAIKTDRQYPGICHRLGLGKDWDHVTRQLLGMEPLSHTSELYPALCH